MLSLCPVACSNCGPRWASTLLAPPPAMTLSSTALRLEVDSAIMIPTVSPPAATDNVFHEMCPLARIERRRNPGKQANEAGVGRNSEAYCAILFSPWPRNDRPNHGNYADLISLGNRTRRGVSATACRGNP